MTGLVNVYIVLTGVKASGKSTIGPLLAGALALPFVDVDDVVLLKALELFGDIRSCAELYRSVGELQYRRLEIEAVREIEGLEVCVLATGGSTLLTPSVRELLRARGKLVFLSATTAYLWKRIEASGTPSYLERHASPEHAFYRRVELIRSTVMPICDCTVEVEERRPEEIVTDILFRLKEMAETNRSSR